MIINQYYEVMKPLYDATIRLHGYKKEGGDHGVIWLVLLTMELLLRHFEQLRTRLNDVPAIDISLEVAVPPEGEGSSSDDLNITDISKDLEESDITARAGANAVFCTYLNLGWQKLNKHYKLTNDLPAYLAAIVLYPAFT